MRVDLDDDKVGNRSKPLKFNSNTWNRFCLMEQQVEFAKCHFHNGYKWCTAPIMQTRDGERVNVNPHADPQGRCAYCDNLEREAFDRFAMNVVLYLTDPQGQPLGPLGPRSFLVQWWPFSTDRWESVRMFKKTYGDLRKHDLVFHCTEAKYQKGELHCLGGEPAWWLRDPDFQKIVAARFKDEKIDLSKKLARHFPYDMQLRDLNGQPLTGGGAQGPQGQQGQNGGQQPMFNPQAIQGQIAAPMGGAQPMFGGGNLPPQESVPQADLSLLDSPTSAPAAETTSDVSSQPPASDESADTPPDVAAPPTGEASPDTTDLDAMLANMND